MEITCHFLVKGITNAKSILVPVISEKYLNV